MCIESFSRRPEHRTVDSCVVCLLSHGVEGAVYGTDGQLLQVCDYLSMYCDCGYSIYCFEHITYLVCSISARLGVWVLRQCTLSVTTEQTKDVFYSGMQGRYGVCSSFTSVLGILYLCSWRPVDMKVYYLSNLFDIIFIYSVLCRWSLKLLDCAWWHFYKVMSGTV